VQRVPSPAARERPSAGCFLPAARRKSLGVNPWKARARGIALALVIGLAAAPARAADGGASPPAPEAVARERDLVFADQPLDQLLKEVKVAPDDRLWGALAEAESRARAGKRQDARRALERVLAMNVEKTRMLLVTWTALRALGVRPPAELRNEVQGVVCELHDQAGVETLAAYVDGRVQRIAGNGATTTWDTPGKDAEIDAAVTDLLKAVEAVATGTPMVARHHAEALAPAHFRATVLTFGGPHVKDARADANHAPPPILQATEKLRAALDRHRAAGGK
jgi:hypothetical protein